MCIFRRRKDNNEAVAGLVADNARLKDQLADAQDDIRTRDNTINTLRNIIDERNEQLRKVGDRNDKLQYKLDYLKKFVEDHGLEVPKEATNLKQRKNGKQTTA